MKSFGIGRFVFFTKWAKSGTWEVTTEDSQRTLYFSILKVTRNDQDMYGMIIGALVFYIAYIGDD